MTMPLIYAKAVAITPHDSTNFPDGMCRAIYVGTAGAATIIMNGAAIVFTGLLAGNIYPIQATRVNSTALVAGALVALY